MAADTTDEARLLSEILLAYLDPAERGPWAADPAAIAALDAELGQLWDAARAAWPELACPLEVWVRMLASHLPRSTPEMAGAAAEAAGAAPGTAGDAAAPGDAGLAAVLASLARVPAADLYLAAACGHGEPRALRAFEDHFFGEVPVALRKLRAEPHLADELAQRLRQKLFVAEPGEAPQILEYAGRGSLRGWFRVVTLRTAVSLLRQTAPEVPLQPDDLGALPAREADPELALLRGHYGQTFRQALAEAAAELSPEERNLLRQHFVDRLTLAELATLHQVHRITVFRRVDRARQQLIDRTRELVGQRLQVAGGELGSVIRVLQSRLDLSLGGALAEKKILPGR